tara:strand:- start:7226 stop:7645 length:420 start_codon:yes stop_codon:yes gene_type:complete
MKNYQIPVAKAAEWTALWRKRCPNNCKAFLLPVEDLVGVLKEMKILQEVEAGVFKIDEGEEQYARAYMAIDALETKGGGEKVLLVGTKKEPLTKEKNVYRDIINGDIMAKEGDGDGTGIYDFSKPCPEHCDPDSPLFGG